jgi:hypothetical protein
MRADFQYYTHRLYRSAALQPYFDGQNGRKMGADLTGRTAFPMFRADAKADSACMCAA